MRRIAWALFVLAGLLPPGLLAAAGRVIDVSTSDQLVAALAAPLDDVTVRLAPGDYVVRATPGANAMLDCNGSAFMMAVTTGLIVTGNRVRLVGPRDGQAMIVTDAGYKIHFKDCRDCELERVKVMGPPRDEEHASNDAAIVVSRSTVRIANCKIVTDIPPLSVPPTALPGGDGIRGADGADLTIEFNEITCFAWGIVVQKGARAVIRNNLLEGAASMRKRGALLATCDADVVVERNLIRTFPRGAEVTGRPAFVMKHNILEDMTGDGVFVRVSGGSRVEVEGNVMYRCGTIGIDVESGPDATLSRNLVVDTGIVDGAPNGIRTSAEVVVRNHTTYPGGGGGSRELFWRARRKWTQTYRNTAVGVDGRHKFHQSAFLARYGRWMH